MNLRRRVQDNPCKSLVTIRQLSSTADAFPILEEAIIDRLWPEGDTVWLHGGASLPPDHYTAEGLLVVLEGSMDAFIGREDRRTHLATRGRGQFTGDIALLKNGQAEAIGYECERARVLRIAHGNVRQVLVAHYTFGTTVTNALIYPKLLSQP